MVLAADQVSKWWVLNVLDLPELRQIVLLPVLNLTMVWNRGVTFGLLNGLGAWGHVILAAVALAVVGGLMIWLRRAETRAMAAAIGAIAAVRSAMSSIASTSAAWWISSMPISTRHGAISPGMCSMLPTRRSYAG